MRCVDVLVDQQYVEPLLKKIKSNIENVPHKNNSNYIDFEKRLFDYEAFHIVIDDDDNIYAMAGLYNGGIYPSNTVRALDRTYYFNWDKENSIYQKHNRYNTKFFWPAQYEVAKQKGYSSIFFSVQDIRKRNAGAIVASRTIPEAKVLPDMYNTCRKYGKENTVNTDMLCWQNIYLYKIKEDTFDLPSMKIDEYKKRYLNESSD